MPVSDTPNDVKVVRIRRCNDSADADAIHSLVKELAEFERMPDGVLLSADDIRRDGFNTSHPLFFAALAEERVEDGWSAVGFLLCYYKYSTWEGRCIHMEDLYVRPSHRRRGIASRLFAHCVEQARSDGCRRLEWNVLDWNVGAKQFYAKLGAFVPDNGSWELMRFDDAAIKAFKTSEK